jgi:diadenosine tetraphosphate (Ap4A) HIT family hydrolase
MYDKNNIFAKILRKEIPCKVVYEDNSTLIFHDANPVAPIHLLAIPKGNFTSFDDFSQKASEAQMKGFFSSIQTIAKRLGIIDSGYRLISNHGSDAMQTVDHFHVHILAGKRLGDLVANENNNKIK